MVQIILDDGAHTYSASTKVITLEEPYVSLSVGQIIKIVNLTRNEVLYDADIIRYQISKSGADITHTYDNTDHSDSDLLQVTVDLGGFADNPVHVEDYLTSVSEGDVADTDSCIGSSDSIGAGAYVILSNCVAIQPASPGVQMEVVSTSTDDTLLGIGAQKVEIEYFTETPWAKFTEIVEMDGQTAVDTVATDIYRINKFKVVKGSPAAGTITLKSTNAAILYAQIDQYETFFERCIQYVETGSQAIVTDIILGCSTNGGVKWRLFVSDEDEDTGDVVTRGKLSVTIADDTLPHTMKLPFRVSNPNGKRIAIGLAVQGPVAVQKGTGTIWGYCKQIGT